MSSFLNRYYWFGIVGLHTLGLNQQGVHICTGYVCISQQVILLWCRGLHTLGLEWGVPSTLGMAIFLNRFYWFVVVGLCTLGLNYGVLPLLQVYLHFSLGSSGLVQQGFVHLVLIRGEGLFISQQVILVWCSRALYTWDHLVGEGLIISQQVILVCCNMSLYTLVHLVGEGLFGVVGFWTLGHNWGCPSALGRCAFLNRLYWFGVVGLCTLGVDQQGRVSSFLNRLYWFGVVGLCSLALDGGSSVCTVYVHISQQVLQVWCGRAPYTWGPLAGEGLLISQQVILDWCSTALYTWAQLGCPSALGTSSFLNR